MKHITLSTWASNRRFSLAAMRREIDLLCPINKPQHNYYARTNWRSDGNIFARHVWGPIRPPKGLVHRWDTTHAYFSFSYAELFGHKFDDYARAKGKLFPKNRHVIHIADKIDVRFTIDFAHNIVKDVSLMFHCYYRVRDQRKKVMLMGNDYSPFANGYMPVYADIRPDIRHYMKTSLEQAIIPYMLKQKAIFDREKPKQFVGIKVTMQGDSSLFQWGYIPHFFCHTKKQDAKRILHNYLLVRSLSDYFQSGILGFQLIIIKFSVLFNFAMI